MVRRRCLGEGLKDDAPNFEMPEHGYQNGDEVPVYAKPAHQRAALTTAVSTLDDREQG